MANHVNIVLGIGVTNIIMISDVDVNKSRQMPLYRCAYT